MYILDHYHNPSRDERWDLENQCPFVRLSVWTAVISETKNAVISETIKAIQ